MKKSKTSIIVAIIGGVATIVGSMISFFAGEKNQENIIINTVGDSNIIKIHQDDSSVKVVNTLIGDYKSAILENESLVQQNNTLNEKIEQLKQQITQIENTNINGSTVIINNGTNNTITKDIFTVDDTSNKDNSSNENLPKRIPSVVPGIRCTRVGDNLEITVKSSLHIFNDEEIQLPFVFGVYVYNTTGENAGDYSICAEFAIDENYSVSNVEGIIYQRTEEALGIVGYIDNEIIAYFDKENDEFVIKGNFSNDYVKTEDFRINSYSYSQSIY